MVVLLDTNIILDVLQKREGLYDASFSVIEKCAKGEYKIYKYLGFEAKVIRKYKMNHEWCVVKLTNLTGGEVAYGIDTASSLGDTFWWSVIKNHDEIFYHEYRKGIPGEDFCTIIAAADTGYNDITIGDRIIKLTGAPDYLNTNYYTHRPLKYPTNQTTPAPTPTPTPTATPTSEPEAPMDIDEIDCDEDEDEAA